MEGLLIKRVIITIIINSGAKVSVMPKKVAERAKLIVLTNQPIFFQLFAKEKYIFYSLCYIVEVNISKIINYINFFIVD
jgi:predicted ribosome-associated RNA-binding protein Tma20